MKPVALEVLFLLLAVGVLALGLPPARRRVRRTTWHAWLHTGILPLAAGLVLAHWRGPKFETPLQALLALATAGAGMLVGTQLRGTYLRQAGLDYLGRQSLLALGVFTACALPAMVLVPWTLGDPVTGRVAIAGIVLVACMAVATCQRPPDAGFAVSYEEYLRGHVASAGWWNLLAIAVVGAALCLSDPGASWRMTPAALAVCCLAGVALGWLALHARGRGETLVFLLAGLGSVAGFALATGIAPIMAGFLLGAAFGNTGVLRPATMERVLEDLEQPAVIATGFLAGLCLSPDAPAFGPIITAVAVVLLLRWGLRGALSPTSVLVAGRGERRIMPPGATGVLLVGATVLAGPAMTPVAQVLVLVLILATVAHVVRGVWARWRGPRRGDADCSHH